MKTPLGLVRSLYANLFQRNHSARYTPANRSTRRHFLLEPLEGRVLLSADLIGVPDWTEQGPAISINGQTAGLAGPNPVSGAMEAIAAHPTDANTIYVGTVGGGIWRTTDGGTSWAPLTDQWASLSIGAIAFSPLDATNSTLFAGTGSFSSGGNGGPAAGALRTTDGGNSWVPIGSEFSGERVRSIVPTSIGTSLADQVVLAATIDGGGVYRSVNGGNTFVLISGSSGAADGLDNDADGTTDEAGELNLPNGSASHLVADPGNTNRFYTAIPGQGVFRSDNGGVNWVQVNNGLTNLGAATRIELSVSAAAGNPVYVALISGGALANVFRSANQGGNWTAIGVAPGVNPGNQGGTHFSILADNAAPNIVYVGGDRQAAAPFVGNLFRGDSTANTWTSIVLGGALGTAPHADSRDMVFDAMGRILESDDGGIYRLVNPNAAGTVWQSLPTMPRVAQFITNIDYDELNNTLIGGTQDTGSPEQISGFSWRDTSQADGGFVAVDNDQVAHPGTTFHYSSSQNFGGFTRRTLDNTNTPVGSAPVGLVVTGAGGKTLLSSATMGMNTYNFDPTVQFTQPFVLNSVNPARMLIGTSSLYESTDRGDTLTPLGGLNNLNANGLDDDLDGIVDDGDEFTAAGAIGTIRVMVYGGRSGGVDNADLIYVATGATLRLRTANSTNTMADFTIVAGYTGGAIRDMEIDPDDWTRGYVLDSTGRVFRFVNSGAAASDWTNITGNLANLTSDARDVELFTPTSAPGDDFLLISGFGGVFRTLSPGPLSVWNEFGANVPNVVATDLVYDAADDVLSVGTYGRGAFELAAASTLIPNPGVLQITGDDLFPGQDDVIRLVRNAANPALLDVFLNSVLPVLTVQLSTLQQINVDGLGGNDRLIVDSTNGLISVPLGIRFNGGDGVMDQLQLVQTGGPDRIETINIGPENGSGVSFIAGGGMGGAQIVMFENLEPVLDLVPGTLSVTATASDNAISYTNFFSFGQVAIDEQETVQFANKSSLTINAGAGQDTISVNTSLTPAGLTAITINGGDPGSGDVLIITGVGAPVTVNTSTRVITGATGVGGAIPITYATIEAIDLAAGIGALTLNTTGADDTLEVTPGLSPAGSNSGTLTSGGVTPDITFTNSGAVTANLGTGMDSVVVNGSSAIDIAAISGAAVAIMGRHTVNFTGAEAVTVNGNAGSDTFNVTPSPTVGIFVDGGDPVGAMPGDLLNIIAGGQSVTYNAGPETDEGSFVVDANQPVSFDHIESFGITGSGPAVINGTNGPDTITVIARDASTHPPADGIQDFTVSVNTGPDLLFINVATLTINALSGSDQVTIAAPAPNNAVWNVDVTVNGGAPAADSDRLIVQTPGAAGETVIYTPSAADGGTLDLSSLSSIVTINTTEKLSYDGQTDNDNLAIAGTAGPDTIVLTPGSDDQAGTFQVNSLLALDFQNIGAAAVLSVDGDGGTDTFVYNGTGANDTFTIGAAGQVSLNARTVVNTAGIEVLTLEGFAGDDTFTLLPAISASAIPTINLNGGAQASATGDRTNLIGTAGDDNLVISGQVVSLGAVTVNSSGVESIQLDALGGDDLITYNGVAGVTENITVGSSGIAGGGQIDVPNVTLINFGGAERIDVNGNAPTPTETDTLAFAGTNDVDIFQINLAALGTDSDPILVLQTAASATLLTLRNYTNFETLRVIGLDGEDTFNVYTAAVTPVNRNLFIDGGLPTGKKKSTDNLNVFYASPRPRIIHSAATQDPDAGLVDLTYDTARFLIQYDDVEQVVIRKT